MGEKGTPSSSTTTIFSTILSINILASYPLSVEGLPIQQVPSPSHNTECEFDALEQYNEQCGSTIVRLPSCRPGEKRIWWCESGTNGFPDNFDAFHDACGNCPQNTFQSRYNKCRTCHPCSQCEEGQIEEMACEMDHDTLCRSVEPVSTTSSLPFAPPLKEATPRSSEKATPALDSSPASTPTEGNSLWPTNRTDLPKESPVEPPKATLHVDVTKEWVYRAFIMVLIMLLVLVVIGWRRECLLRKKLQAMLANPNDIPLEPINNNGAVIQRRNEDQEFEERAALLGEELPGEGARSGSNQATSNSGAHATTGSRLTKGSPDGALNLGPDDTSDSTSDNTSNAADDGSMDGSHGTGAGVPVDGAIGTLDSTADGASGSVVSGTHDSPQVDTSSLPDTTEYSNCGATDGASDGTNSGAVVSGGGIDEHVPDDERLHDIPVLPSDIANIDATNDPILPSITQYEAPSKTGSDGTKSCTNGTNSGEVVFGDGIILPIDAIPQDIPVCLSDGPIPDMPSDPICTLPNNSQDEAPSKSSSDSIHDNIVGTNGGAMAHGGEQTSTNTSNNDTSGASGCGIYVDVPVEKSPHGIPVSARGGACGPPSNGDVEDVRRASTTTEELNPGIKADDVVTTQFLQHVAQEISHIKSKTICRRLGLLERDIEDVEALTHKDEQGFEFLKKLLGRIGKDLTYRSLIGALIKSKNKHYADNLIRDFNILM